MIQPNREEETLGNLTIIMTLFDRIDYEMSEEELLEVPTLQYGNYLAELSEDEWMEAKSVFLERFNKLTLWKQSGECLTNLETLNIALGFRTKINREL